MRLLVDMNLSPRWVAFLHAAGLEAIHWTTVGRMNATDLEIMAWAKENSFVVLTHDLDFSAILAVTRGNQPSVVQIRADDVSPEAIGAKVVASLHNVRAELEAGALLSIDVSRSRLRLLPLSRDV